MRPIALPSLTLSNADRTALSVDGLAHPDHPENLVVALFDQFRAPLLRYLASLGLTMADGEEVIQETFLALYQHLNNGKSRRNLRGWLFRVAHNLGLKRRQRSLRDLNFCPTGETAALAADPGPNPEDLLADTQTRQRLMAAVDALPPMDRRCLFLRAEGLRYREIAEILDISLGSVSMSLARSLVRMTRVSER